MANALPIVGVLFLGWEVFALVLLYWLENVVVGGYNVAKLLLARPGQPVFWGIKLFFVPFFVVHFGGFTYAHGLFVLALFAPTGQQPSDLIGPGPAARLARLRRRPRARRTAARGRDDRDVLPWGALLPGLARSAVIIG